jgi:hypothetical protein
LPPAALDVPELALPEAAGAVTPGVVEAVEVPSVVEAAVVPGVVEAVVVSEVVNPEPESLDPPKVDWLKVGSPVVAVLVVRVTPTAQRRG